MTHPKCPSSPPLPPTAGSPYWARAIPYIEQSLPDLRTMQLWRGIDRIEQVTGLIVVWAGNLAVSAVPVRAFPSEPEAQAFVEACRQRAGGASHGG